MMAAALAAPEPQSAFLKEPELVIGVWFTAVRPSASRWRLLYVPPLTLAECLERILEDLKTPAWCAALMPAVAEREPRDLANSLILLSAGKGEGRWPLAYLMADIGTLDRGALRQAFSAMGGQV